MQRFSIKILFLSLALFCAMDMYGSNDSINYLPEFHGTLRGRFEMSVDEGVHRFQVRNARVSANGRFAPWGKYFLQVDLCQGGKMVFLDAYAMANIGKAWSIKAGQFRIPFGVEMFQVPHEYLFANRPFISKQMSNYRGVGAQGGYIFTGVPVTIEAGAFNLGSLTNHLRWNSELSYAAKATCSYEDWLVSGGFESIIPYGVRINMVDLALRWHHDRWRVESEYLYEHFTNMAHAPCHGYNLQADYSMPVKWWYFDSFSLQGRFDGMTAGCSGKPGEAGRLLTDYPDRNRITVGSTIGYHRSKSMYLLLRIDYEKNFYRRGVTPTIENNDCVIAELMLRF